ncbi:hypothetical protein ACQK5W_12795 [Pantoea sp. FN060301]|uniref:hypothetical protein n=1 Tax=Pantoea sp. FN060301 TaxID=3420380 RepID=UPI003D17D476
MSNVSTNPVAEAACSALRWAAFGGRHRGLPFTYRQLSDERWHFETEYDGNKAWVDLELPVTPLSLLIAGAVLIQQLNCSMG